jgi:hypothetical protein
MKMTVYNIETGEAMVIAGVDAREFVNTGGWSYSPQLQKPDPEPEVKPEPKKRSVKKTDSEE